MNRYFSKWKAIGASILATLLLAQSLGISTNRASAAPPQTELHSAATTTLSDIGGSYARTEIQALVEKGILSGFQDGTYKPLNFMTRAELAKVLSIAAGLKPEGDAAGAFTDIPSNAWYKGYAGALVRAGIANGVSIDRFDPNGKVSREQLAAFFVRAMGLQDEAGQLAATPDVSDLSDVAPWALPSVKLAFSIGFLQGTANKDGSIRFNPKQHADRQALARLAFEFVEHRTQYEKKAKELTGTTHEPDTEAGTESPPVQTPTGGGAGGGNGGGSGGGGGGGGPVQSAPAVLSVVSTGIGTAEVIFDKAAGSTVAEDYIFAPALTVSAASLKAGNDKVVVLTTGTQQQGAAYALSYKGISTGKSMTSATTLSVIEPGEYKGNYRVASGVKVFGPADGVAVIQGKLQLDPGADGELLLRNVQADTIEILSGASESIHLSGVKVRLQLVVNVAGQSNSVRVVAEKGTSIARTNVGSGAILQGAGGLLGDIYVEDGAANQQIGLEGHIDGKVTMNAEGAKLNINSGATVALIEVLAEVELDSAGGIASIVIAAPTSVKLAGNFDGTISVTAEDANITVGESAQVASLVLKASAVLMVNGELASLQSSNANIFIQLSGTQAGALGQQLVSSAESAIAKLPEVSGLKLEDRFSVREARAKTTGALLLEPAVAIAGIDKLVQAEEKIKQLAAAAFNKAVEALPQDVWLDDREDLRESLKSVEVVLRMAKDEDVPDTLLTGLARFTGAQFELRFLDQLAGMIADANAAIAKLPEASSIKADQIATTRWLVNEAERTMKRAQDNGASNADFVGIDHYIATRDRLLELEKTLDSNGQFGVSVQVELMKLAAFEQIRLSDRIYIEWVRSRVDSAILFGAIPSTLEALSVLTAAEAKLKELETQKSAAVQVANRAIAALPAAADLKLNHAGLVDDAQTKATTAIQLGAAASELPDMDKLTALANRLTELLDAKAVLVKAAQTAIAALPLPDKLKLTDIKSLQLARSKVQAALDGGAAEKDISNLAKLKLGESRISALQLAQAAEDAIGALPPADQLKLDDSRAVAEARAKASAALALPGITAEYIPSLARLVAVEARIAELAAYKVEKVRLASTAIGQLPAPKAVSAADGNLILAARQAVNEALAAGALQNEIDGFDKLEAVEAAYALLSETAEPLIETPIYGGTLLLIGTAEAGAVIRAGVNGKTATVIAQADGRFFLYDDSISLTEGDKISVTAQGKGKRLSTALVFTAEAIEGQTAAPSVQDAYEGDWFLDVTAQADAMLYLLDGSGNLIARYTPFFTGDGDSALIRLLPSDGSPLSTGELRLYARSPGRAPSLPVSVEVRTVSGQLTSTPIIDGDVYDTDDWMEVKTEPYAAVRVMDEAGKHAVYIKAGIDGRVNISLQEFADENRLTVLAKAPGKRAGEPLTVTLLHATVKAEAPVVTGQSGAGYLLIEGNLDVASTLELDETISLSFMRANDEHFYAFIPKRMKPGDHVTLRARQKGKLPSDPVTVSVAAGLPQTEKPTGIEDPVAGGIYLSLENKGHRRVTVIERADGSVVTWNLESDEAGGTMRWYLEPEDLSAGTELRATSTRIGASTSEALTLTVRAPDKEIPGPKIEGLYYEAGVIWIRVRTEPHASLLMTAGNSRLVWEADDSGLIDRYAFSDSIPNASAQLQVQAAGRAIGKLIAAQIESPETDTPTPTVTDPVYADSSYVRGRASSGDLIVATTPDGFRIGEGRAAADGSFQLYLYDYYNQLWPAGSTFDICAIGFGKKSSPAVQVHVAPLGGKTGSPIAQNELYEGSFELRATAEPNASLFLKDKTGRTLASSVGNNEGLAYFSLENVRFAAGDTLFLTADVPGKAASEPTRIVVLDTKGITELQVTSGSLYTNGFVIEGTTMPNARIKLMIGNGSYGAYADETGKFRIDSLGYWRDIPEGQSATLFAMADGFSRSAPVAFMALPTAGKTGQPVLDATSAVYEDGWILKGTADANTVIRLSTQEGLVLVWQSGSTGDFWFYNDESLPVETGGRVYLTALTPGKATSDPIELAVGQIKGQTATPELGALDEGTLYITGHGQPYSRYTLRDGEGNILISEKTYSGNDYVLDFIRNGVSLTAGQSYTLTADAIGRTPSDPVPIQVAPASGATSLERISASVANHQFSIFGSTDPGASVELIISNGGVWTTFANAEGHFYFSGYWDGGALQDVRIVAAAAGKHRSETIHIEFAQGTVLPSPILSETSVAGEDGLDLIGTVEPGSSLKLLAANGAVLAESGTFFNADFHWTTNMPLPAGPARLVAVAPGREQSLPVPIEIRALAETTGKMELTGSPLTSASLSLQGAGEPGSQAYMDNEAGERVAYGYINMDGRLYMELLHPVRPITTGATYELYAQAKGKKASERLKLTAGMTEGETDLTVDVAEIYVNGFRISGTAPIGTDVVLDYGGNASTTVTDGTFNLTMPVYYGMPAGSTVTLYATAPGKERLQQSFIVKEGQLTTQAPSIIANVYEGDHELSLNAVSGAFYTLQLNDGPELKPQFYKDSVSTVKIVLPAEMTLQAGDALKVTATIPGMLPSPPVTAVVWPGDGNTMQPRVFDMLYDTSIKLSGQTLPGATVTLHDASGEIVIRGEGDTSKGNFFFGLYPLDIRLRAGETYSLVAQTPGKPASAPLPLTVKAATAEKTQLELTNKYVTSTSFSLSGMTDPFASVMLRVPDGFYATTADMDGSFIIESATASFSISDQLQLIAVGLGKQQSAVIPVAVTSDVPVVSDVTAVRYTPQFAFR